LEARSRDKRLYGLERLNIQQIALPSEKIHRSHRDTSDALRQEYVVDQIVVS
jgi:hypothetical protein